MRCFAVSALVFLGLAGCATGPSLESRMAAYIGAPEAQLVQALGVPDKQITVDGVTYLAYVRRHEQVEPDMYAGGWGGPWGGPYGGWGGPYYGPYYGGYDGFPRDVLVWSCETTFLIHDGKVVNFVLRGNDCR
jgi:hypothetical protein